MGPLEKKGHEVDRLLQPCHQCGITLRCSQSLLARASARRTFFLIFPVEVLGSALNSMYLGHLKWASRPRQNSINSAGVAEIFFQIDKPEKRPPGDRLHCVFTTRGGRLQREKVDELGQPRATSNYRVLEEKCRTHRDVEPGLT